MPKPPASLLWSSTIDSIPEVVASTPTQSIFYYEGTTALDQANKLLFYRVPFGDFVELFCSSFISYALEKYSS
jgi:hypothetical protein